MAMTEPRRFRRATGTCLPAAIALIFSGFGGAASAQEPLRSLSAATSRLADSLFKETARSTERSEHSANRQASAEAATKIAQRGGARSACESVSTISAGGIRVYASTATSVM